MYPYLEFQISTTSPPPSKKLQCVCFWTQPLVHEACEKYCPKHSEEKQMNVRKIEKIRAVRVQRTHVPQKTSKQRI